MRAVFIVIVGMIAWQVPSSAQSESERESLRGLRGIAVTAKIQDKSEKLATYANPSQLQTRVELRLRQSGVRVLANDEMLTDARMPTLDLFVFALPSSEAANSFAISMRLSVNQRLWRLSQGKPVAAIFGNTWEKHYLLDYGITPLSQGVLGNRVDDLVDAFLNDWLATHGK